jgi:hypothetical protein
MFQLVKFSCGCIGTKPVQGISTVIDSCDGEGGLSFYQRTLDKAFEPLEPEVNENYREEIQKLIFDGYNMKTIRSVLGVQTQLKKLLE